MNYRKIRKAIECPQFGNEKYGKWGALRIEQRVLIKRLLNELDNAENCVKKLYLENIRQKDVIKEVYDILNNQFKAYLEPQDTLKIIKCKELLKEVQE